MSGRYKIKTIAERSGFSATLLRAWERRYAFLQPERQPSGHRLYTEDDLRVLKMVKLLLDRGQSVGEVAALGRESLLRLDLTQEDVKPGQAFEMEEEHAPLAESLRADKKQLVKAVTALDMELARNLVRKVFSENKDLEVLQRFTIEVAHDVGVLWVSGKVSVASEHMLSGICKEQLHVLIRQADSSSAQAWTIICAGFPDELHELGLLFLQYELSLAGHRVVYLGPALPFEDLDAAISRLQPHLVCLSVARGAVLQVHLPRLAETVKRHVSTNFVVGGEGVRGFENDLYQVGVTPWERGRSIVEATEVL